MLQRLRVLTGISLLLMGALAYCADSDSAWQHFARGDAVLLLRHALAPGNGDPTTFELRDCATQRNLAEEGRAQALNIGQWLRQRGITHARVWSSQWCRCLETAKLLDLGRVVELPGLNSFYELPQTREPNLRALRAHLRDVKRGASPMILVTHFVTIGAMTGVSVGSGEGVIARLDKTGSLTELARVEFDAP